MESGGIAENQRRTGTMKNINQLLRKYEKPYTPGERRSKEFDRRRKQEERKRRKHELVDEIGEHVYHNDGAFLVFSDDEDCAVHLYSILSKEYFGLNIGYDDGTYVIRGFKSHFKGMII